MKDLLTGILTIMIVVPFSWSLHLTGVTDLIVFFVLFFIVSMCLDLLTHNY